MGSLQILKSSLSPFAVYHPTSRRKSRWFTSESNFHPGGGKFVNFNGRSYGPFMCGRRRVRVYSKLQENDDLSRGEEPPESLFMKELRKRGMSPTSLLDETTRTTYKDEEAKQKEEEGGYGKRNAVSTDYERSLTDQRATSMALNSEGLEGLIPRAKLLLSLGGTFFLAFGPLILVTVAIFTAMYLYFGPTFVHDGTTTTITPPTYIDPYALLEDDRITQTPLR